MVPQPVRLLFGTSVVAGAATADVFAGVTTAPASFPRPAPYTPPEPRGTAIRLGGPWAAYRDYVAHGLSHLSKLLATPEIAVHAGARFHIPVLIENAAAAPAEIALTATTPAAWKQLHGLGRYPVAAHDVYPTYSVVEVPPDAALRWHEVRIQAAGPNAITLPSTSSASHCRGRQRSTHRRPPLRPAAIRPVRASVSCFPFGRGPLTRRSIMLFKPERLLWLFLLTPGIVAAQPMPPPPPPPPAFMTMKGLPLSCFAKPTFEEDGLEFFVCNGGGGLAGVRKESDPSHNIFVRDLEIAQNLNMRTAQAECGKTRFADPHKAVDSLPPRV